MGRSRDSWDKVFRLAVGTSICCFPLICCAAQVEEPRAGVLQVAGATAPQDAQSAGPDQPANPRNYAIAAAVADGVSTKLALSAGALEANPLAASLPLVALTGAKVAAAFYAETLPENEKRLVIKASSSVWGGAAVNNLLLLIATPPPVSIAAGILTGILVWRQTAHEYDDQDRRLAALQSSKLASAPAPAASEPRLGVAP